MESDDRELEISSVLVESVYDSANNPKHREAFLREHAQAVNGTLSMFRVIDERLPTIHINVHYNLDPDLQEAHRQSYVTPDDYIQALRHGLGGMIEDAAAVTSRWTFRCSDVRSPVHIFHGERDGDAPVGMGRWLARHIPQAEVTEWSDAMHFEAFRRWSEILSRHAST